MVFWLLPGAVPLQCDRPQAVASAAELSVCKAIEQLTALNGKEVALRGEWITNDHGEWLRAPGGLCTDKLVTGRFVWPNAINLVQSKTSRLSFDSLAAMEMTLKPLRSTPGQYTVVSTFIGRLETRVPLSVVSYPDGTVTGYGFGHLDFFPAELHYYDVKNVVLKANRR
jgi:hypothetical protein